MTRATVRAWYVVHKWTSVACTAFLLMLCVTGLPLIFHDEIDALFNARPAVAAAPPAAPLRSLDAVIATALAARPGEVGLFLSFDEDRPVVNVTTGPAPDASEDRMTFQPYDLRTGEPVGVIEREGGIMAFLLGLHTDLFLGLPGMLFLGFTGLLFAVAIVSGVVLYAPFTRKLPFGTVRASRSTRVKWLDVHNLLGIVTLAWTMVVGLTGVINTLATPIVAQWRAGEVAAMTAGYRDAAPPRRLASVDAAVARARAAAPGTRPQFVAFPGGAFSSDHHYTVFLQGATPLTKRLLTPALIDARTGALTAIRPMPWYMGALFLSQPLHFGDYGGLPLKILWALLDLLTIAVLGSGLYLWLGKRRAPVSAHVREIETGGLAEPAAA
jgi:uncharacterized iron-regulated membrane protein